jgi:hypothetical protein
MRFPDQLRKVSKFVEHKDMKGAALMMCAAADEIERLENLLHKEEYEVNGIRVTHYTDENNKTHAEATKNNCTGHGSTGIAAIIELGAKLRNTD